MSARADEPLVLGIETSCDETSAAVLDLRGGPPSLQSLVILSQDIHAVFGGVVPELASRAHLRTMTGVVDRALAQANIGPGEVDAVAVTAGAASVVKGTLGIVGLTLAVLLLLPIVGTFHVIHDWLPSTLAHAPVDLLSGTPLPHFFPALAVTVLASAALLAAAVARLGTREL